MNGSLDTDKPFTVDFAFDCRLGRRIVLDGCAGTHRPTDPTARRLGQVNDCLSRDAVRLITTDAGMPGHCGMGWWTNGGRYPELPQDAVWGAGAGDKVLLVIPSLQLVVVRSGQGLLTPEEVQKLNPQNVHEEFHDPREKVFFRPLMETIN